MGIKIPLHNLKTAGVFSCYSLPSLATQVYDMDVNS